MRRVDFGTWVFAYGSLMAPAEAARTLGRVPEARPALVEGLARAWMVGTAGRAYGCEACGGRLPVAVVLGCVAEPGARTQGVVLRVSAEERGLLDRREASYAPRALDPAAVHARPPLPPGARVIVYEPLAARRADAARPGAAVPDVYARTASAALRARWGPDAPLVTASGAGRAPLRTGLRFAGPDPSARVPDCRCTHTAPPPGDP